MTSSNNGKKRSKYGIFSSNNGRPFIAMVWPKVTMESLVVTMGWPAVTMARPVVTKV